MTTRLTQFAVKEIGPCKVVGKAIACTLGHPQGNPVPAFWGQCMQDGTWKALTGLEGGLFPGVTVGWCGDLDFATGRFNYFVGALAAPEAAVPEGMQCRSLVARRFAVASFEGPEAEVFAAAHDMTLAAMAERDLRRAPDQDYDIEWYDQRWCPDNPVKGIDYLIPVE